MIYCKVCGNEHKDFKAIQFGPASLMVCDYCKADLLVENITEIIPFVMAVILEATARAAQRVNTFATGGIVASLKGGKELLKRQIVKPGNYSQKGPWIPKPGDEYWFIDSLGYISQTLNTNNNSDCYRIQRGNCFQTEVEAERYRDIDSVIYRIVFEKNQEKPLDWKKERYNKYSLRYDYHRNTTIEGLNDFLRYHKTLYCSKPFLDDVLKEISQADLDWYMVRG